MRAYFSMKKLVFILLLPLFVSLPAQEQKSEPIQVLHADKMILNKKYPDLKLLTGHVQLQHKDALLTCDKALLDTRKNFAEAIGNVELNQGDTLRLTAGIIRYDGSRDFALAMEKVHLTDPTMQLDTDTLFYDKRRDLAYYRSGGIIRDTINTIRSRIGRYYIKQNRYEFQNGVRIDNPDYRIRSVHLDYDTRAQITRFLGPTEIRNASDLIYAEGGQYHSRDSVAWFTGRTFVRSKDRWTSADSIYADRQKDFYAATGRVRIKDSTNGILTLAGYAEMWNARDSVFLDRKPVVVNYDAKDTLYLAAGHIIVRKRDSFRETFAYPDVRFFQRDFSGRADSLYQSGKKHRIELHRRPVLWNNDSQITGRSIVILNDSTGRHIDSLLIPRDVFIAQKDSAGFNQIKGKELRGKFIDGRLRHIDIRGNTETVYYLRDDQNRLTGIDRSVCSEINIDLDTTGQAVRIYLRDKPQGTTYPPGQIPPQSKQLKGFEWRGKERIASPDELLEGRPLDFDPPKLPDIPEYVPPRKSSEPILPKSFLKGM